MEPLFILLQAEASSWMDGMGQFGFFAAIIAVFYFFMIRPQQKKQKEEQVFRDSLAKGDKVLTIGGIYGEIEKIDDTSVLVRVDNNTKLRFEKTALRAVPASE